jgi:hypothetical protein
MICCVYSSLICDLYSSTSEIGLKSQTKCCHDNEHDGDDVDDDNEEDDNLGFLQAL